MHKTSNHTVVQRLADKGFLSPDQLRKLQSSQPDAQPARVKSLLASGVVPERAFASVISELEGVMLLAPESFPAAAVAGTEVLADFLREHEALPIDLQGKRLRLAMTDPSERFVVNVLQTKLGVEIEPLIAVRSDLLSALDRLYQPTSMPPADDDAITGSMLSDIPQDIENESVLVRDLHRLIQRAIIVGASDIHFEPVAQSVRVRFRVTGMLRDVHSFPAAQATQVIARIKLMAKLDVTERRQAQNGRFKFPADGKMMDLRVSTLPLHEGESIVMRLLEFQLSQTSLAELGFTEAVASGLEQVIALQQGMVLITGPTGSGKTTTLYNLMNRLNRPELKLISIEDPVELDITGINQIRVDEKHGIGFAEALKTVLRQDPDVIMVGEIRDPETARLAAQAALTGHLVLSTIHTASAPAAITRLQNLGLPDYLIAATLTAVLSQRLVRQLCPDCRAGSSALSTPKTCERCEGAGYLGRTSIAEFLSPAGLQSLFSDGLAGQDGSTAEDTPESHLLGGVTLADDAQRLISDRTTDEAEIFRVLGKVATP